MPSAQEEYDSIMNLAEQIERLGDQVNPYTTLTKDVGITIEFPPPKIANRYLNRHN